MSDLKVWMDDFGLTDESLKQGFVHKTDAQRVADLQALSSWFNDPKSTLRKKAELMRLGRELNAVHLAMRKAGK